MRDNLAAFESLFNPFENQFTYNIVTIEMMSV